MTIILKFWLCIVGTVCAPDDAASFKGTKYNYEMYITDTSLLQCNETDAITNDKYLDAFIAVGVAPRHTCEIAGGDDL